MIYLLFKSALDSTRFLQLCECSSKAFGKKKKNPGGEIVQKSPPKDFMLKKILVIITKDCDLFWRPCRQLVYQEQGSEFLVAHLASGGYFLMNLMNSEAAAVVLTNSGSHLQLETGKDDAAATDL